MIKMPVNGYVETLETDCSFFDHLFAGRIREIVYFLFELVNFFVKTIIAHNSLPFPVSL